MYVGQDCTTRDIWPPPPLTWHPTKMRSPGIAHNWSSPVPLPSLGDHLASDQNHNFWYRQACGRGARSSQACRHAVCSNVAGQACRQTAKPVSTSKPVGEVGSAAAKPVGELSASTWPVKPVGKPVSPSKPVGEVGPATAKPVLSWSCHPLITFVSSSNLCAPTLLF